MGRRLAHPLQKNAIQGKDRRNAKGGGGSGNNACNILRHGTKLAEFHNKAIKPTKGQCLQAVTFCVLMKF